MILNGECVKTALQTVQVKVAENFVGSQSGVVTIHAGDINGFYFQTGKIYLIVAKPLVDRTLTVTSCGGIKARLDAKDDLAYLRSWTAMPKFGTLLGTATVVTHDPQRMVQLGHSLKYQRITVSGPRSFDVVTDKNGRYTVAGLSAGQYSVSIADPREVWPSKSQNADLVERGCAEVDFYIIDDQKQVGKGKH